MLVKAIALFALVAAVNGQSTSHAYGQPQFGAQAEHTVRGFGGLSSVSQYSKSVDSPFSAVRKTDTRVTNDAVAAYAAPAYAGYAAPIAHPGYAAPIAHPGYAAPIAHPGYAAPIAHAGFAHHAAPVAYANQHFSAAPAVATYHFNGVGLGTYAY